ncbi:MAG: hypothetical protein WC378_09305 [Opitutaceae bacterium]|jgi:hypothetical protein
MSTESPSNSEVSPPLLRAFRSYLASIPSVAKKLGAGLFEEQAVRSASFRPLPYPPRGFAVVRDRSALQCSFEYEGDDGWQGACGCADGKLCRHLFAAGQALLVEMAKTPADILDRAHTIPVSIDSREQSIATPAIGKGKNARRKAVASDDVLEIAQIYEQLTGKRYGASAKTYFQHLRTCERSLRFGQYPALFSNVEPLLPAAHRHRSRELAEILWLHARKTDAKDIIAFWRRVAIAMDDLGVGIPEFMAGCADLAALRAEREALQLLRATETWKQSFVRLSSQPRPAPVAATRRRLRLRISQKRMRWELSIPQEPGTYSPINADELRNLVTHPREIVESLDCESCMLICYLQSMYDDEQRLGTDLKFEAGREMLAALLENPLTAPLVVGDVGAPLLRDSRKVVWKFGECPENAVGIPAMLRLSDGSPLERPFYHLRGRSHHYLSGATLFDGPPPPKPFADDAELEGLLIPRDALRSPEAAGFAVLAGVEIPEEHRVVIEHLILEPLLCARLDEEGEDLSGMPHTSCLLQVRALAPDGTPRAFLQPDGWNRHASGVRRKHLGRAGARLQPCATA